MATQEEKLEAVSALRNRGKKPVVKVAKSFGVSVPTLHQWQKLVAAAELSVAERVEPEPAQPNGNGAATNGANGANGSPEQPALPIVHGPGNGKAFDMTIFDELARLRAENAALKALLKTLL